MEEVNITYYLVWNRLLAKREEDEKTSKDYIFVDGKWVPDEKYIIMDHLMGYDPSEPEDSPYSIGSTSIMMEMKEISEENAVEIMNQQI